jgi:hypothetical protein
MFFLQSRCLRRVRYAHTRAIEQSRTCVFTMCVQDRPSHQNCYTILWLRQICFLPFSLKTVVVYCRVSDVFPKKFKNIFKKFKVLN